MKKQKGITLIALIITIIVMLILVGVTVTVAINGNLFNNARNASRKTQIKAYEEELQAAVVEAYNVETGEVELSTLATNLRKNGWEVTVGNKATCTSPKGDVFIINREGKIRTEFDWTSVGLTVDTSTEYICEGGLVLNFSKDGELVILANGKIFATVDATNAENIDETTGILNFDIDDMGEMINIKLAMANEKDINMTIDEELIFTGMKIEVDNVTIYSNEEVLKRLGITNYTGTYTGTWTKIGEENGKIKLVSTRAVTDYTLGYEDPRAIETIPAVDESAPTNEEKRERGIWSYKNAVNTLNTLAKESTGISNAESIKIEDIYSIIGEENIKKGTNYGKVYNFYYNTEDSKVYSRYKTGTDEQGNTIWSEPHNTGYSSQTFVNDEGNTVVVDSEGDEVTLIDNFSICYLSDDVQAVLGQMLFTDDFWLGSRYSTVVYPGDEGHFGVHYMRCGEEINYEICFWSRFDMRGVNNWYGVRTVVWI